MKNNAGHGALHIGSVHRYGVALLVCDAQS